jgi:hypothetical protein
MLRDATGVELMPMALRLALGEQLSFGTMPTFARVGYLFYVHAPFGMHAVQRIDGLDELRADPSVQTVTINRGGKAEVDWREGNHGHVLSVGGTVADHAQLEKIAERVQMTVRIHGS